MARSRTFKTGVLAFGTALTSMVGLFSAMVLVRLLSKQDYGTFTQTLLAYTVVSPLLMAGLPTALLYFLPRHAERTRSVLVENLLGLTALGAGFLVFMLLGGNTLLAARTGEPNPALEQTLLIFAPYALLVLPATSLTSALMSMDRYRQVAVYSCVSRFVMLSIAVGACWIWRTPVAAVWGQVIGAAVILPAALRLMWRACHAGPWRPTWAGFKEQFVYSFPVGLTRGFGMFRLQLDRLLIAGMYSAEQYAVYAVGAVELPLVGVLTSSVSSVLLPETTRLNEQGREAEAVDIWRRAGEKSALLVFPITVFFYFMAPEVMTVLFSADYAESADPFRVYTLQLPLRIVNISNMFFTAGRTGLVMWIHLLTLVVNAAMSLVLVRVMGPVGAAWGSFLSLTLCMFPVALWWIGRHYGPGLRDILPFRRLAHIAAVSLAPAIVFVIRPWLADWPDYMRLGAMAVLYGSATLLLLDRSGIVSARALWSSARTHIIGRPG